MATKGISIGKSIGNSFSNFYIGRLSSEAVYESRADIASPAPFSREELVGQRAGPSLQGG